jgi:hypothetical protein
MSVAGLLVIKPMSQMGQKLKSSMGAYVFRSAPNNGHRATTAACPKSASMRHRKWTRPLTKGRLIRLYAKLRAEICVSAWSPACFWTSARSTA